jgi:hypothetical protein
MQTARVLPPGGRNATPPPVVFPSSFPNQPASRIHMKIFTPEPLADFNERQRKNKPGWKSSYREPDIQIEQLLKLPSFLQTLKINRLLCSDYYYYMDKKYGAANVIVFQKTSPRGFYLLPTSVRNILTGTFRRCEAYVQGDERRTESFKLWPENQNETGRIYQLTKNSNSWQLT